MAFYKDVVLLYHYSTEVYRGDYIAEEFLRAIQKKSYA